MEIEGLEALKRALLKWYEDFGSQCVVCGRMQRFDNIKVGKTGVTGYLSCPFCRTKERSTITPPKSKATEDDAQVEEFMARVETLREIQIFEEDEEDL